MTSSKSLRGLRHARRWIRIRTTIKEWSNNFKGLRSNHPETAGNVPAVFLGVLGVFNRAKGFVFKTPIKLFFIPAFLF